MPHHIRKIKRYGWRPQLPDIRDFKVEEPEEGAVFPPLIDLSTSPYEPAIYDQGQLGSCTANAAAGVFEFELKRQGLTDFTPSRLAIYYGERVLEGTVSTDSGANPRDAMKVLNTEGVGPESGPDDWPYNIAEFAVAPPPAYVANALKNKATSYAALSQTLAAMRAMLATRIGETVGTPFTIGFTVYESFESAAVAASGIVPMPKQAESIVGGHDVVVVGYNDTTQMFRVRNSWGASWGQDGYCEIPYAYLTNPNLASGLWVVKVVS
jgi:C1A family cysteine protease